MTQDSLVAHPATRVAGFPNAYQWTPQSHLEACADHRFSRGPSWEDADIARGPEVAERRRRTDPPGADVRFSPKATQLMHNANDAMGQ